MDLEELKLHQLGIDKNIFGKIYSFVDFGNVNYWYEKFCRDFEGKRLEKGKKLIVDIEKMGEFIDLFSEKKFFYYGLDLNKPASWHIKRKAEKVARFKTISKPIQRIKHYIDDNDYIDKDFSFIKKDNKGKFIIIPKCNFDVELTVDATRLADNYNTIALFSSDSDFARLFDFLKKKSKKIILVHSEPTTKTLRQYADLKINANKVRNIICKIKHPRK